MIQIGTLNMPESLAAILIIFGTASVVFLVFLVIVLAKDSIDDYLTKKKYKHKRKHRFDKPPLAKCYCKDCKNYGTGIYHDQCYRLDGYHVAENYFCWAAEPRTIDPDKEDDKNV